MKRLKKAVSMVLAAAFVFSVGSTVFADDTVNPIGAAATEISDGSFTVNIVTEAQADMQAFKYVLNYDYSKLRVAGTNMTEYGFYSPFLASYNVDKQALTLCNNKNDSDNGRVIFTGAQANSTASIVATGTNIAYIRFQTVQEVTDDAAYTEVLSGISLSVEHLEGNEGNLVSKYPQVFEKPVMVKRGSTSLGEEYKLGDVDNDNEVTLSDAQIVLKAALKITSLTDLQKKAADATKDGEVTLEDAQAILKAALKIITLQ